MKKVIIASTNRTKTAAVELAFTRMFPGEQFQFLPEAIPSGVSDQPMTSEETARGALNRVEGAEARYPQADFWVGMEGGCEKNTELDTEVFAYMAVKSGGITGKSRTGSFILPAALVRLMDQGLELGEACDRLFAKKHSKYSQGSVGLLTGGVHDRTHYYVDALILALIPFKNMRLYASNC